MTHPTRAAIEERLRKATPGPWLVNLSWHSGFRRIVGGLGLIIARVYRMPSAGGDEIEESNADFIANAPTDIAFLLAEIDRLGKQCEGMATAAMNNGQQLMLYERALEKIVELRCSEAGEPLDEAIDVAEAALKTLVPLPTPPATTLSPIEGDGE